jgi:hypothetical protein
MLTQNRVKEIFDYDSNGYLIWKIKKADHVQIGSKAGGLANTGYMDVRFDYKLYLCHRVIFLWHHGWLPKIIDHIDNDKTNNKIENLRAATSSQNGANSKARKNNTSGVKGISYVSQSNRWHAYINKDRKRTNLGYFKSFEDAKIAVQSMRQDLYQEFARDA